MKAVIQRVQQASVEVDGTVVGKIGHGLLVLLGVEAGDTQKDLEYVLKKTVQLRIFPDASGKMNLAVGQIGGKLLVVSQFTLLGDLRRGNRPGFSQAAEPGEADRLYQAFVAGARDAGLDVETGVFRTDMQVSLINDGPVTLIVDSRC